MRHGKKVHKLGRTSAHRKALMMNLAIELIEHKRIQTTQAKAKALRVYIEPLVTRSKEDTLQNRRLVFSHLQSKEAVNELFETIGDKVADRPGGYTRIIKLQARRSDAAELALIEFVDFNELYSGKVETTKKRRTRRSRRAAGQASEDQQNVENVETEVVEEPTVETEVKTEDADTTPEQDSETTSTDEATEEE